MTAGLWIKCFIRDFYAQPDIVAIVNQIGDNRFPSIIYYMKRSNKWAWPLFIVAMILESFIVLINMILLGTITLMMAIIAPCVFLLIALYVICKMLFKLGYTKISNKYEWISFDNIKVRLKSWILKQ